jgi:DNA-binding transcriptional LysR family regulator
MNWGVFDLNLLVVFDAVMQERSVTRAGQRIGLSQPATSHALSRLRYTLKDELFVRTPKGMVPTPRAEQLAAPLRRALIELQSALERDSFDPAKEQRRFTIALCNYAAEFVAPPLVAAAAAAAPRVQFDLRESGTDRTIDLLDSGELDLALIVFSDPGERFALVPLLSDELVLIMRAGHPAAHTKLTAETTAALDFLQVSPTGVDTHFVDEWLAGNGLALRCVLRAPRLSVSRIIAQSDLVAITSRRTAEAFAEAGELTMRPLPCAQPDVGVSMLWHRRVDNQPAHRWLREQVLAVCRFL